MARSSLRWWREIRVRCELCGYDKVPEILTRHHRDFNCRNNARRNIQPLCPTCHALVHYKSPNIHISRGLRGYLNRLCYELDMRNQEDFLLSVGLKTESRPKLEQVNC